MFVFLNFRRQTRQTLQSYTISGWWFGCHFLFSHILGIIIPIDELIFFRGVALAHQPDLYVSMAYGEEDINQ